MAGTVAFIALWVITMVPGNPITGRGGPAGSPAAIIIEVSQIVFVALVAAIIAYENRARKRTATRMAQKAQRSNSQIAILAAIVVALVLIGAFVSPMAMPRGPAGISGPRPRGGPPGSPSPGQVAPPEIPQGQQIGTIPAAKR